MAEEQIQEQVDTQEEKTVSVSEMQRRLTKQEEQFNSEITSLKESQAEQIQQAIEKYKAESELSGKELEEYRRQEAEREKQELLDQIAALQAKETKRGLTDEAIKTLSNRKLPVNDTVLGLVVKDTAEDTLSAIDAIESIISQIKNDYAESQPPMVGGIGSKTQEKSIFDLMDEAGK